MQFKLNLSLCLLEDLMVKQIIARSTGIFLFPLLLFFLGCEKVEIDAEDFLRDSEGTFNASFTTDEEGTRAVEVTTRKAHSFPGSALRLSLNIDGHIGIFRYRLPEKALIENGKVKIPFDSKLPGSQGVKFVRIEGLEFFLADVHFKAIKDESSGEYSFELDKLVFWRTGLIPPPFKKKYKLYFNVSESLQ